MSDSIEELKKTCKEFTKNENLDDVTQENISNRNQNWSQIPDHSYRILIIGCTESGKQMHYII